MRRRRPVRTPLPRSAFAGFRFPPEVITVAVRWYLRYGLSYRDVEELLAERGIDVDHVTVYRWVQRFTPLFIDAARPCRHATGDLDFRAEAPNRLWVADLTRLVTAKGVLWLASVRDAYANRVVGWACGCPKLRSQPLT
jgi:transposase InsO family protein